VKPPCGTQLAYQWHRWHGEEPCPEDRRAAALDRKLRRRRAAHERWQRLVRVQQEALIREAVRVLAEAMGAWQ
jgi:hypothetical protein